MDPNQPASTPSVPTNPEPQPAPQVPPAAPIAPASAPPTAPSQPTAGVSPVSAQPYISNPFELIKPSWAAIKLNLGAFLFPALISLGILFLFGLLFGVMLVAGSQGNGIGVGMVLLGVVMVIAVIALAILFAPYSTLVLLASARGQKVGWRDTFRQSRGLAWKFLGLGILIGLAIIGGFILLIIPGLIFLAWFSLSSFVLVSENVGPVEAMKRSKALVKGRVFEMWGMMGFNSAFALLGLIPILGSIALLVLGFIYSAAPAIRYLQLSQSVASGATPPKVHWANYLVLALAVISLPIQSALSPKVEKQNQPFQLDQLQDSQSPFE